MSIPECEECGAEGVALVVGLCLDCAERAAGELGRKLRRHLELQRAWEERPWPTSG